MIGKLIYNTLRSVGVKSYNEDRKWLEAANNNDANAQFELGKYYLQHSMIHDNINKAMKWFQAAADNGNVEGTAWMGYYLVANEDFSNNKDAEKGVKFLHKAADEGSAFAFYWLGYCYRQGLGVQKNDEEAFKFDMKAVEMGFDGAYINVADNYMDGVGTEKNPEEAAIWYKKTFNIFKSNYSLDDSVRSEMLCSLYERFSVLGDNEFAVWSLVEAAMGEDENAERASVELFHMACSHEDDFSCELFAWEQGLYNIIGKAEDSYSCDETKVTELKQGAQNGDEESMFWLGLYYLNSVLGNDVEKFKELMTILSDSDFAPAMLHLGKYYCGNDKVELGMSLLEKAGKLGYTPGYHVMGNVYYHGSDRFNDYDMALKYWLYSAALSGSVASCKSVAEIYGNGYGREKNMRLADLWHDINFHRQGLTNVPNGTMLTLLTPTDGFSNLIKNYLSSVDRSSTGKRH